MASRIARRVSTALGLVLAASALTTVTASSASAAGGFTEAGACQVILKSKGYKVGPKVKLACAELDGSRNASTKCRAKLELLKVKASHRKTACGTR